MTICLSAKDGATWRQLARRGKIVDGSLRCLGRRLGEDAVQECKDLGGGIACGGIGSRITQAGTFVRGSLE